MWEGVDFKPISMSDVLLPAKVKSAYRRAMLVIQFLFVSFCRKSILIKTKMLLLNRNILLSVFLML